jgi:hypothetical protein
MKMKEDWDKWTDEYGQRQIDYISNSLLKDATFRKDYSMSAGQKNVQPLMEPNTN